MRLQKKVFRIIVGTLLSLSLVMSFTTNHRTIRAFESIERRFFEKDMFLLQRYIDEELNRLSKYVSDWGAWDSMYAFMETRDVSRFDELLNGASLRALDIDFLAVLDEERNVVVGYFVNDLGGEVPLSETVLPPLKALADRVSAETSQSPESDEQAAFPHLIKLDEDVYLFANNPILMTNWGGPSKGQIVVGVNFARKLQQISGSIGIPSVFLPVPNRTYPDRAGNQVAIEESRGGYASVWQRRGEVVGADSAYALVCRTPRYIYNEGKKAVYSSYLWIFLNGIVLSVVVIELLSHMILKRLERLREVADTITDELRLSLRVPVTHDDEISDLSRSFNVVFGTLDHIMMNIPDAMILCTPGGHVVLTNTQTRNLTNLAGGMQAEEGTQAFEGMPIESLIRKNGVKVFICSDKEQDVYEAFLLRRGGGEVPVEIHQRAVIFGRRKLVLFLARDLTERKRLETRLAWRLYYDDLTGLPNRTSLFEALANILKEKDKAKPDSSAASHVVLALINMDHFKSINAEVGDINGDRVLMIISEKLKSILEDKGTVYRTGGDEFAALLRLEGETLDKEALNALLEQARDEISQPCIVGEGAVYPSASIGVLTDVTVWSTPSLIVEKAASALKGAKRVGLGAIIFFEGHGAQEESAFSTSILSMRAELRSAIENNEFVPYFQPVYSIKERKLSGFETLVRWMHPQKGFLPSSRFVPYAERIGLVGEIDRCMMHCALEAIRKSSSTVYFSSNGSSNLLQTPDVVDIIRESLDASGVKPSCFVIEVTESVLIDNLQGVSATLEKLRDMGIRIFLDDFGTGYSSLQYIHSLPLDCIKLDIAFVRNVCDSEKEARMLRTIIDMANVLNLDTIAEGVETLEQLTWLGEAGCGKAQGYYFSKPMAWSDAAKLISREGGAP